MNSNNDYYYIGMNDLCYLQCALKTTYYNKLAIDAQQVIERMLKSVAERACVGVEGLLHTHNLRALYDAIHKELPNFYLDRGALSILKDYYYDLRYPGHNYVDITREECEECIDLMYDTIKQVNAFRQSMGLPIKEFKELPLGREQEGDYE